MMNIERREEKGNWLQHLVTKAIILSPPYFGSKSDYESLSNFKKFSWQFRAYISN